MHCKKYTVNWCYMLVLKSNQTDSSQLCKSMNDINKNWSFYPSNSLFFGDTMAPSAGKDLVEKGVIEMTEREATLKTACTPVLYTIASIWSLSCIGIISLLVMGML